jgi:hypothetical protein
MSKYFVVTSVKIDCFDFVAHSTLEYWSTSSHLSTFTDGATDIGKSESQFVIMLSLIAIRTSLSDTPLYELFPLHTVIDFATHSTSFMT